MPRLPISTSFILGCLCRLSGLAAAILVLRVSLSRGWVASTPLAVVQLAAALLLAVLIGNLVKELTFGLMETLVTACGHPFVRKSATVTGRRVSEVWLPGGRWVRCETWRRGAALAWTERDGSCTGIEMPAMTLARTHPLRTHKAVCSRGQVQEVMTAAALSAARLRAQSFQEAVRGLPESHGTPGGKRPSAARGPAASPVETPVAAPAEAPVQTRAR